MAPMLVSLLVAAGVSAQTLSGRVVDAAGAPVPGARVTARQGGERQTAETDSRGAFRFLLAAAGPVDLEIEAAGFSKLERQASAGQDLRILLERPVSETVTVTATRSPARLGDVAESVVVLDSEELEASASPVLDAALRQVPGFSLFRRSDSRYANPTAQGVSLRGVGASGASRALVLDDGIPLNDPFGGWVYWSRVPGEEIDRVEVLRSGGSDLYGSPALGGVVNLVRRRPAGPALSAEASAGSEATGEGSLFGSVVQGPWRAAAGAESFVTDGSVAVPDGERGPVDTRVNSRFDSADATVENSSSEAVRLFLRGSYYSESRHNGTPLQRNDTIIRQAAGGADGVAGGGSYLVRAFADRQELDQTFSSIATDRASETLVRAQRVPASGFGGTLQWSMPLFASHAFVCGAELRDVLGASDEDVFVGPLSFSSTRGRQRSYGLFAEDIVAASDRLTLQAGARFDGWRSFDGKKVLLFHDPTRDSDAALAARSETAWSPRLAAVYRLSGAVSLAASAYRGFRAPTLNELYRSFRVGNVDTEANENLQAERSSGGELGATLAAGGLALRSTLFETVIDHPIANVTIASSPSVITRMRENAGRTRTLGAEADAEARVGGAWRITAGYLYADSRLVSFPADPALEGRAVPQVPREQATLGAVWHGAVLETAGLQARWVAAQFEDDQNQLRLKPYFTLDVTASRALTGGLEAFFAVENVFGKRYEVGRTPVTTLGPPRLFRAGLRLRLG